MCLGVGPHLCLKNAGEQGLRSMLHDSVDLTPSSPKNDIGVAMSSATVGASRAHVLVAQEYLSGDKCRTGNLLRVFQRSTGLIIEECVPKYVKLALKLMEQAAAGSQLMSSQGVLKYINISSL